MKKYSDIKIPMSSWADTDIPTSKLLLKGKNALSNAELLSIVLRTGSPKLNSLDLAKLILKQYDNNLTELSKANYSDLIRLPGIGKSKALAIISVFSLGKRATYDCNVLKKISHSRDAYEYLYDLLSEKEYESFYILVLNRANKIIKHILISEGSTAGTVADPKKIFKLALENNATSIILAHNHPSGNIKPSASDLALTKKLKDGGEMLDCKVLDHIIVGNKDYHSMSDENEL